jgi:hypothetical protein
MISARYLKYPKRRDEKADERVDTATIGDLVSFGNGIELKNPRFNCYVFTRTSSQPDVFLPPDVVRMVEVIATGFNFGLGVTKEGKIKIRIFVGDRSGEFLVDPVELKKIVNVYVVNNCIPNVLIIEEIRARLGR